MPGSWMALPYTAFKNTRKRKKRLENWGLVGYFDKGDYSRSAFRAFYMESV